MTLTLKAVNDVMGPWTEVQDTDGTRYLVRLTAAGFGPHEVIVLESPVAPQTTAWTRAVLMATQTRANARWKGKGHA